MQIWVDADAAPRDVKDVVFKAAERNSIQTMLVANSTQPIPANSKCIKAITVREGANVADRFILQQCQPGDLVITADIPLAAELVAKEALVIDPRGEQYHADNIGSRLSMRDFMDELRGAGTVTSGSKPYSNLDKKAFASTFDRLLSRRLRELQAEENDGEE